MNANAILIIYTGGTVGMVRSTETGSLVPFNFAQIAGLLPELKRFPFAIDHHTIEPPIDSSDITPEHWRMMAKLVADNYEKYDGFVVLHGTDTMAYSATALSFLLQNLGKPVVFTGAQLPIGEVRTDARENILTAIELAGAVHFGMEPVNEVTVYFDYYLFRGNRCIKSSNNRFEAFSSPNYPPLAEAGTAIRINKPYLLKSAGEFSYEDVSFSESVAMLTLFPGISESQVRAVLMNPDLKAVVLSTYGSGNIPGMKWLHALLKEAVDAGTLLINVSQCRSGRVEQGHYEAGRILRDIGVIGGIDLTFEAAVVKAQWLLGKGICERSLFEQAFSKSVAGELVD